MTTTLGGNYLSRGCFSKCIERRFECLRKNILVQYIHVIPAFQCNELYYEDILLFCSRFYCDAELARGFDISTAPVSIISVVWINFMYLHYKDIFTLPSRRAVQDDYFPAVPTTFQIISVRGAYLKRQSI